MGKAVRNVIYGNVGFRKVALCNASKSNYRNPSWNALEAPKVTNLTGLDHPAVLGGDVENE
jgi:hypothetical protein